MKKYIVPVLIGLVLISCGRKESVEIEVNETPVETVAFDLDKFDLVDLSEFGIPATIHVPNKNTTQYDPVIEYNDEKGEVKIMSGNKFNLVITESDIDKDLMVSDLEGDLLFKNTVVTDEDQMLVYTSELPDGSLKTNHFCAWFSFEDSNYMIKNDPAEEFSEHFLNRMIKCVKSMEFINPV